MDRVLWNGNLLDGANNLIDYTGEVSINPAVDTIQEFNVMTGVMPAEYGFTGGGIINMATKSGLQFTARERLRILAQRRLGCARLLLISRSQNPRVAL